MRRWPVVIVIIGWIAVLTLHPGSSAGRLHAGDTLTPCHDGADSWHAGQSIALPVRLTARGPEETTPRRLGFGALPAGVNPVAEVTFYAGDYTLETVLVELSHRC